MMRCLILKFLFADNFLIVICNLPITLACLNTAQINIPWYYNTKHPAAKIDCFCFMLFHMSL